MSTQRSPGARLTYLAQVAGLAVAYIATARLGLALPAGESNAALIWIPTGISIAVLIRYGWKLWPGVALGAFVANLATPIPAIATIGITLGNTGEALIATLVLKRLRFDPSLIRMRDVAHYGLIAGLAAPAFSATVGTAALWFSGATTQPGRVWEIWWLGDAFAALIIGPLLLTLASPARRLERRIRNEAIVFGISMTVVGWGVIFSQNKLAGTVLFPMLLWGTLRFSQRGTSMYMAGLCGMAFTAQILGHLPPGAGSLEEAIQSTELSASALAISFLLLGAMLAERRYAQERLQRREEQLIEAQSIAHLGSWEWDIGTDRVEWSSELYRIFDVDESGAPPTYAAYIERIHPEDRERVAAFVKEAFETTLPYALEHRYVTAIGQIGWLQCSGHVVTDGRGVPIRMLGTALDVTDRKLVELTLLDAEERFRTVFENSGVGMVLALADGRMVQCNDAFREMVGYRAEELASMTFEDVSHRDDVPLWRSGYAELVTEVKQSLVLETRVHRSDGEPLWVRGTTTLIRDDEGGPRFTVSLFENITERKHLESFREDFITKAAHELRTPLTSLAGFGALLATRRHELSESQIDEATDVLKRQGQRVTSLVNNLLDLSKIEHHAPHMQLGTFSLATLAKEALDAAPPPEGLSVEVDIGYDVKIRTNDVCLESILMNLLNNAYKYGEGPVRLRAESDESGMLLHVEDSGDGVPDEFVPHLFEPFSRGPNVGPRQGSGLGLALTRRLVESLGGEIWYERNGSKGAHFAVRLKAAA
ncbi:MAG TPA: PAS domain-containing protein [Actinomycetota bacterium]|nr:PAS domain-containing protein [Actinomycetota bacterium]